MSVKGLSESGVRYTVWSGENNKVCGIWCTSIWSKEYHFCNSLPLVHYNKASCCALVICDHGSRPVNSRDFSRCKALVNALHCRAIFVVKTLPKVRLKSPQVNVNILPGIQMWNQKPGSYMAHGDDAEVKTSDWCIMINTGVHHCLKRNRTSLLYSR